jgi:hypothetical protein
MEAEEAEEEESKEEAIFHKDLSGKYLMEETSRVCMR